MVSPFPSFSYMAVPYTAITRSSSGVLLLAGTANGDYGMVLLDFFERVPYGQPWVQPTSVFVHCVLTNFKWIP